jgi:CRP/FNR family cyclic AMP-dependent transcriptional regulator
MPLDRAAIAGLLRRSPLLAPLTDAEIDFLCARTGSRSHASGEILFNEGEPCTGLHIVASGRVRIFKVSAQGREHVLAIEGPGSSIAELPVFDGGNYPASASAAEDSEIVFISRKDLHALCMEHPEIALKLLQVVGGRLRRLVGIIEELSFTTVRHRLISWLLREARFSGRGAAVRSFTLSASHQELASQIGTVRELVSRNMARLQAQGFIEVSGREVTIVDLPGLEAELQTVV